MTALSTQNTNSWASFKDYQEIFGRSAGALLNKIFYWITKTDSGTIHDNQRWVFNTYREWGKQISYSECAVKRAIKTLKDLGVLSSKALLPYRPKQMYYTVNADVLKKIIQESTGTVIESFLCDESQKSIENSDGSACVAPPLASEKRGPIQYTSQKKNSQYPQKPKEKLEPLEEGQYDPAPDMFAHWEETFPQSKWKLNDKLIIALRKAFNEKFESNLKIWKNYCARIESSDWIMGRTKSKFFLNIYSVLSDSFFTKIMAGGYGTKDIPLVLETQEEKKARVLDTLHSSDDSDEIKQIRTILLDYAGPNRYESWFEKTPIAIEGDIITITAQNRFCAEQIPLYYRRPLDEILDVTQKDAIHMKIPGVDRPLSEVDNWDKIRAKASKETPLINTPAVENEVQITQSKDQNDPINTNTTALNTNTYITNQKNELGRSEEAGPLNHPQPITLNTNDSDEVKQIRKILLDHIGPDRYEAWFEKTQIAAEDNIITMTFESNFCAEYIAKSSRIALEETLNIMQKEAIHLKVQGVDHPLSIILNWKKMWPETFSETPIIDTPAVENEVQITQSKDQNDPINTNTTALNTNTYITNQKNELGRSEEAGPLNHPQPITLNTNDSDDKDAIQKIQNLLKRDMTTQRYDGWFKDALFFLKKNAIIIVLKEEFMVGMFEKFLKSTFQNVLDSTNYERFIILSEENPKPISIYRDQKTPYRNKKA